MVEKFPESARHKTTGIQESEQLSNKIIPETTTSKRILIKLLKSKDKKNILNTSKEKQHFIGEK